MINFNVLWDLGASVDDVMQSSYGKISVDSHQSSNLRVAVAKVNRD
jgi:hypothetical protein